MVQEAIAETMINALLADMAAEDLGEVREQLAAGVEAAEEQASEIEAEDKTGLRQVQRLVGALAVASLPPTVVASMALLERPEDRAFLTSKGQG